MKTATSNVKPLSSKKLTTKDMVLTGMFAAILTVISQISLPMPTGVPITIQVFGVALVGSVLGWKLGLFTTFVYILIGAVGLPVFSNFQGGMGILAGLTGGYIIGWPFLAALSGIRINRGSKTSNMVKSIILSLVGLAVVEIIGGLQWSLLSGGSMTISAVFIYSMVAFIPKDIIITIAAVLIGHQIRKPLVAAGYL